MKILFTASEAMPYIMTGGLGEVAGALPAALSKCGNDVRVIIPLYKGIPDEYRQELKFVCNYNVQLGWRNQYCGVYTAERDGITFYFVDNEFYFKREGCYGFGDDGERFAFFCLAALELPSRIGWMPDVIHAHDWHTAMVPVYYRSKYAWRKEYEGIKTVFTIHNIEYQGKFDCYILGDLFGLDVDMLPTMEYGGCLNLMKAAIISADRVSTVSPTYAKEITTKEYAHGLDPILREHSYKLSGILNGIDVKSYNPWTDPAVIKKYSAGRPSGKKADKLALLKEFGLPEEENVPLIGMVTRLVSHKGLDLVRQTLEAIIPHARVVLLGSGDEEYERFFTGAAGWHSDRIGVKIGFDRALSRRIYAGADMFLMPSKSEPCGLAQMIALRYGTLPIVRETGGLADSVKDCGDGVGNGFSFKQFEAWDMLDAIMRAIVAYKNEDEWKMLVERAMRCDFSWTSSAKEYVAMYEGMF